MIINNYVKQITATEKSLNIYAIVGVRVHKYLHNLCVQKLLTFQVCLMFSSN